MTWPDEVSRREVCLPAASLLQSSLCLLMIADGGEKKISEFNDLRQRGCHDDKTLRRAIAPKDRRNSCTLMMSTRIVGYVDEVVGHAVEILLNPVPLPHCALELRLHRGQGCFKPCADALPPLTISQLTVPLWGGLLFYAKQGQTIVYDLIFQPLYPSSRRGREIN